MDGCLSLLFAPLGLFVSHPFLAFIPAALLLVCYFLRRPAAAAMGVPGQMRWSLAAGLLWAGYAIYEQAMYQWSKTVAGAPIRIDLLLVMPVLYALTATALWRCIAFEKAASRGLDPVKPIRPGPYTLRRNRRFVIGNAIVLGSFPALALSVGAKGAGHEHHRGDFGAPPRVGGLLFLPGP